MTFLIHALRRLALPAFVTLLAGCSGLRLVDNDVTSYSRWQGSTGQPGTTYRFERLPSQQHSPTLGPSEMSQDQLEAAAIKTLARYGLVHHPEAPQLSVQLAMSTVLQPSGYGYGGGWGGPGVSLGAGTGGGFIGLSFPMMRFEQPVYVRELSLVMRDSRSNAVVYETRARHSGPWADARALWPAMLDAALNGFPNPPQGARRVNVEIPR